MEKEARAEKEAKDTTTMTTAKARVEREAKDTAPKMMTTAYVFLTESFDCTIDNHLTFFDPLQKGKGKGKGKGYLLRQ